MYICEESLDDISANQEFYCELADGIYKKYWQWSKKIQVGKLSISWMRYSKLTHPKLIPLVVENEGDQPSFRHIGSLEINDELIYKNTIQKVKRIHKYGYGVRALELTSGDVITSFDHDIYVLIVPVEKTAGPKKKGK